MVDTSPGQREGRSVALAELVSYPGGKGGHRQGVNGMMGSKGMGAVPEVSLMGCGRGLARDAGGKVVLTQGGHQA